jgi:hypothetical protein
VEEDVRGACALLLRVFLCICVEGYISGLHRRYSNSKHDYYEVMPGFWEKLDTVGVLAGC